jgi:hypothetical protein
MRRIAVLSMVTLLAACGSSDSGPGTGYIRFGNLSPDLVAAGAGIDFCIVASGGSFSGATGVLASLGPTGATGLVFGGTTAAGSKALSIYFGYTAGSYDVRAYAVSLPGSSCANPLLSGTVTVGSGGYATVAAIGLTNMTGAATGGRAIRSYTDTSTVGSTQVAARFLNAGFLAIPGAPLAVLPSFSIYSQIPGGYAPVVTNVAYPGVGAGPAVDANGYVVATPADFAAATLFNCPYPYTPATVVAPATCTTQALPGSVSQGAGVIATAFVINYYGATPAALFCVDNFPAAAGAVYAVCAVQ